MTSTSVPGLRLLHHLPLARKCWSPKCWWKIFDKDVKTSPLHLGPRLHIGIWFLLIALVNHHLKTSSSWYFIVNFDSFFSEEKTCTSALSNPALTVLRIVSRHWCIPWTRAGSWWSCCWSFNSSSHDYNDHYDYVTNVHCEFVEQRGCKEKSTPGK